MTDIRGFVHNSSSQPRGAKNNPMGIGVTPDGSIFAASYLDALAREGRVYIASDADQNDLVTGQTSFANTTPTFLLDVPDETVAIPLFVNLAQTGTVAGAQVEVIIEIDNATRYSSGGTAETVLASRTDDPRSEACTLYSGATAAAGYGVRVFGVELDQDVTDPTISKQVLWKPEVPMYLVGPASFAIYTYAGTTGPTWFWSIGWAEIPESELN